MRGLLDCTNVNAANRQLGIYVNLSAEFGDFPGVAQFEDLETQNAAAVVPFDIDLVAPSPSPTSITVRLFGVISAGAGAGDGDITYGLGSSKLVAVQVG